MSTDADKVRRLQRSLDRSAALYQIFPDRGDDRRLFCRSSAATTLVRVSSKDMTILWDLRLFQFVRHIIHGLKHTDERMAIGSRATRGELHVEASMWAALAERALNPPTPDVDLAAGALQQGSMVLHQSLPWLGANADEDGLNDAIANAWSVLFEIFAWQHEISHVEFKMGVKPRDWMMTAAAGAMKLMDGRLAQMRAREDAHPALLELFQSVERVRASKALFEEVLADLQAFDYAMTSDASPIMSSMGPSLRLWLTLQACLHGLAALRLLAYADALRAPSLELFDAQIGANRALYDARALFLENVARLMVIEQEEKEEGDHELQLNRITALSLKLFNATRRIEFEWRVRFAEGDIAALREAGRELREQHGAEDLFADCAVRLGWGAR